jgi:hypothetical protein
MDWHVPPDFNGSNGNWLTAWLAVYYRTAFFLWLKMDLAESI